MKNHSRQIDVRLRSNRIDNANHPTPLASLDVHPFSALGNHPNAQPGAKTQARSWFGFPPSDGVPKLQPSKGLLRSLPVRLELVERLASVARDEPQLVQQTPTGFEYPDRYPTG